MFIDTDIGTTALIRPASSISQLEVASFENNELSGSVPPSLVECNALTHLHWSLVENLLSGACQSYAQPCRHQLRQGLRLRPRLRQSQ